VAAPPGWSDRSARRGGDLSAGAPSGADARAAAEAGSCAEAAVEDKPITVVDPSPPPQPVPAPQDPKRPLAATKRAPAAHPPTKNDSLSSQQKISPRSTTIKTITRSTRCPRSIARSTAATPGVPGRDSSRCHAKPPRAQPLLRPRPQARPSLKRARLMTHVKVASRAPSSRHRPRPAILRLRNRHVHHPIDQHWHFPAADGEYETEFPIILQAD